MQKFPLLPLLLLLLTSLTARAQTSYYVATDGIDAAARDGLSPATAWASLAYACTRVPGNIPANDTINVGPGLYVTNEAANPQPGTTIRGAGMDQTTIRTGQTWTMVERVREPDYLDYIIAFDKADQGFSGPATNFTISDLRLESTLTNLTNGGIYLRGTQDVLIERVHCEDFAWSGVNFVAVERAEVRHCYFENANRVNDDRFGGNIYTRVVIDSRFHHNTYRNTQGGVEPWGVGYKGGFHNNVEISHSDFTTGEGFDIEIPFEQTYGVRIFNNTFNRPVSVPKGGNNGDPTSRGFDYSMWIYDNYFTNGYDIEGTRGYLRVSGNFFDVQNDNGRCYASFGSAFSNEPQWIHNNVAVGVDRSFIWVNDRIDSVQLLNNTIYYEDAGTRAAAMVDIRNRCEGWQIKNNLFVSPDVQPRPMGAALGGDVAFEANLVINCTTATLPAGNFRDTDPGLSPGADSIAAFFPATASSFVVDRGVDVGLPFLGAAPDIGAFEFDATLPVELLLFTGQARPKFAELSWSVGAAEGFSHFVVEELTNPQIRARAQVPYRLNERSFAASLPWNDATPQRTFRLRLVDLDGTTTFSDAITLHRASPEDLALSVYPNPATERLTFRTGNLGAYRIYTANGQRVAAGPVRAGTNELIVGQLPAGHYRLVVIEQSGLLRSALFVR